jgi:hypothetical protein
MLIEIAIVLASIIPSTVLGAKIAHQLSEDQRFIGVMQALVGVVIGVIAIKVIGLALWVGVATTIASQTINAIAALVKMWNRRQRNKALDGDYGQITQWAAELTRDGDMEFAMAIKALPKREKTDIAIIADSKEELRELTMERFEELADDSLPEDFA